MAILRSLGATPFFIFKLYLTESIIVTVFGITFGSIAILVLGSFLAELVYTKAGLQINLLAVSTNDIVYLSAMVLLSLAVGIIPAIKAYKNSISDGLIIRT